MVFFQITTTSYFKRCGTGIPIKRKISNGPSFPAINCTVNVGKRPVLQVED